MNWGSRSKSTSKIKRLGRSVSQRRMPRETEKPPLTMIDEKPTDGTSTSEKDHDGHGMMKSANFKRVPNPNNEFDIFFCQHGHGVMNDFFLDRVFSTEFFFCARTHVVATTVCTTGSVHALTCCTHIFLSTARSLRTSHTSHACHIHAWLKVMKKGSLHMCHISPSRLLQSHVSPILAVPWRSLRDHSWLWRPHVLAVLTCLESAGHAHFRTSSEKFGYLVKSALDTGYEPKKFVKITSVDSDTVLIDDPDVNQISDFSKNKRENTGLFGVLTMFESSVSHVSQNYFCIQVESKESMHRETDCWTEREKERNEREGFVISVVSRWQRKIDGTTLGVILFRLSENSILMDEISEIILNEELNKLSLVKIQFRENYFWMSTRWRSRIWSEEIQNTHCSSHNESLNLKERQLEKAHQWADQAQRERIHLCSRLRWRTIFIKKAMREVAEKLKIFF